MVGRHCPPNRHGLSTSCRKGEYARSGVRWVDVSEAKWWLHGVGGVPVADSSLSLRRAIHGGVKHGETARMIDGILRRCGHGMGNILPTIRTTHKGKTVGNPLLDIDERVAPPGRLQRTWVP